MFALHFGVLIYRLGSHQAPAKATCCNSYTYKYTHTHTHTQYVQLRKSVIICKDQVRLKLRMNEPSTNNSADIYKFKVQNLNLRIIILFPAHFTDYHILASTSKLYNWTKQLHTENCLRNTILISTSNHVVQRLISTKFDDSFKVTTGATDDQILFKSLTSKSGCGWSVLIWMTQVLLS
jgi:hypothetical protein